MNSLTKIRQTLHRLAETSGKEAQTAVALQKMLKSCQADSLFGDIAGHGVLARWHGPKAGPTLLFRAELDALPMDERESCLAHKASHGLAAHKCGHDGHMAILVGLAQHLRSHPLKAGTLYLLFQPAEETGLGARSVLEDPALADMHFDWVFALHNLPGFPMGQVVLRSGIFASASEGLRIDLQGQSSHAAEPHLGRSPMSAVATLITELQSLVQTSTPLEANAQCTLVYAKVGEEAHGTSPGQARLCATLRSHQDGCMQALKAAALDRARAVADSHRLELGTQWRESFPATLNHPDAVVLVKQAAERLGLSLHSPEHPFAWSEDFGHFTNRFSGALFGLGSGEKHLVLHHPDYDFPDELLEPGVGLWISLLEAARLQ
ncbi:MAG TPA: amidohydrolase [Myxococcota bacterium]|nr:amidohydrolase [Myxococcota bacterium]